MRNLNGDNNMKDLKNGMKSFTKNGFQFLVIEGVNNWTGKKNFKVMADLENESIDIEVDTLEDAKKIAELYI